eukprot:gene5818-7017_t
MVTTSSEDPTSNYPREACIPAAKKQVWSRKLMQIEDAEGDWPKKDAGALVYRLCSKLQFTCVKYINSAGQCAVPTGAVSGKTFSQLADTWCFWCKTKPGGRVGAFGKTA